MLLNKLLEADGVSGNEFEVRKLIIEEIKGYVDEYRIDSLGNVITEQHGLGPKIVVVAHMDEVGLMISSIDDNGLIKFKKVGGIDDRVLLSKHVRIGKDKVKGVIGHKPVHLQKDSEKSTVIAHSQMYIDIGATTKAEALSKVKVGDYVAFDSDVIKFGENLIKSKALDDRVGCYNAIRLLQKRIGYNLSFVFTTMEEIGLRGASVATYNVNPKFAIVLEGTTCFDVGDISEYESCTRLGKGPAISLIDRTTIYNKDFRELITKTAEKYDIPYQYRKSDVGGNDSGVIHTQQLGCISTTISTPCRYIHSPSSVASMHDVNHTFLLLENLIKEINMEEI